MKKIPVLFIAILLATCAAVCSFPTPVSADSAAVAAGDVNADGKVNNKDVTRLLQYHSGWNVQISTDAADVNGDGSLNNKDVTRLLQYLSGWKVTVFANGIPAATGGTLRYMSWNLGCAVGSSSEILYVLGQYMPDLAGFQECNASVHSSTLDAFIKAHPEYAHAVRNHKSGTLNYTPIIYNKNKLTLVSAEVEWLVGRYTGTNTKSVCSAVFDDLSGHRFAVINFHGAVCNNSYKGFEDYTSEQLKEQAAEWRLDNARQILEIRDRLISSYGNIPVTVNGDCNFNASSAPYKKIISGGFSDAEKTASTKIKSGYKTYSSYGNGLPGTGASIDHIFGTAGVSFLLYDVVRNDHVSSASDHCPIYVDFTPAGGSG